MSKHAVPRLWPNSTVVCLASGPSLTQGDVDYVRGKARVIAVNDTVRLAPWADVLYSSDEYWWRHHKGVPSYQGMKYGLLPQVRNGRDIRGVPVTVLRNTGPEGLELDPTGVRHGKNSGYAAINLAVHLGAARILLLGYDCGATGRAHFFGNHPSPLANPQAHVFFTWKRLFSTLVEPLRAAGVEIVNCTRATAIECFPQRPIDQALPARREAVA